MRVIVRFALATVLAICVPVCVLAAGTHDYEELTGMVSINTGKNIFNAFDTGDAKDVPVILLHGFPETSYMWRDFQEQLADNGFYSIAFDQRGYSPSARPRGRRRYSLDLLARDVITVADELGLKTFHLVGHDWGSAVGWAVAARNPDRVISWTAMSVPHLNAFAWAIQNDPEQYKASGYMRMFQWPFLPEAFLKSKNYTRLTSIWEHSSAEEIAAYLSVFKQRGAITGALNWYRANYRSLKGGEDILPNVSVPTLFLWGKNDPAILRSGVEKNSQFTVGEYSQHFLDVGHWLIQEAYPEVSDLILDHLKNY